VDGLDELDGLDGRKECLLSFIFLMQVSFFRKTNIWWDTTSDDKSRTKWTLQTEQLNYKMQCDISPSGKFHASLNSQVLLDQMTHTTGHRVALCHFPAVLKAGHHEIRFSPENLSLEIVLGKKF